MGIVHKIKNINLPPNCLIFRKLLAAVVHFQLNVYKIAVFSTRKEQVLDKFSEEAIFDYAH